MGFPLEQKIRAVTPMRDAVRDRKFDLSNSKNEMIIMDIEDSQRISSPFEKYLKSLFIFSPKCLVFFAR